MMIRIRVAGPAAAVSLAEPDDFTSFKVVVETPPHVFIDPDQLLAMSGERSEDPEWRAGFERMLEYARGHGWVNGQGDIRAHVESVRCA